VSVPVAGAASKATRKDGDVTKNDSATVCLCAFVWECSAACVPPEGQRIKARGRKELACPSPLLECLSHSSA